MLHKTVFVMVSLVLSLFSSIALASSTPKISAEEYLKNKANYQLLDVRSPSEFTEGHIQGALNIPHHAIIDELDKLKSIDKTIVVYCRSGRRAQKAEAMMRKNGIKDFIHLDGDMLGWKAKQLPVVKP
ncbi:rhodanese-like domain-containing protein [Psychrosphaera sp.]|nr:rhodanese-like domain-containing protein [Psychrosphaera sp.]